MKLYMPTVSLGPFKKVNSIIHLNIFKGLTCFNLIYCQYWCFDHKRLIIWDNSILFATDLITICLQYVVNTKHLVLLLFFPYTGILTPELDKQLLGSSPKSKLQTECWYLCHLHVTVGHFSSTATNTREKKILRTILSSHEMISICVAFSCL